MPSFIDTYEKGSGVVRWGISVGYLLVSKICPLAGWQAYFFGNGMNIMDVSGSWEASR